MQKTNPCLWFDHNAEEAVNRYVSIFKNSKILGVSRYGKAGKEIHGRPAGSVMTVAFELDGQRFTALNDYNSIPLLRILVSSRSGCPWKIRSDLYGM